MFNAVFLTSVNYKLHAGSLSHLVNLPVNKPVNLNCVVVSEEIIEGWMLVTYWKRKREDAVFAYVQSYQKMHFTIERDTPLGIKL